MVTVGYRLLGNLLNGSRLSHGQHHEIILVFMHVFRWLSAAAENVQVTDSLQGVRF